MSISTCPECGDRFEKDAAWKKTCMPCWKASKRAEHDELLELREEVAERGRLLSEMLAERKAAAIEPEMLARLIRLCHPDKHGNGSEASNTATRGSWRSVRPGHEPPREALRAACTVR
jgi:hypothetical protein